MEASSIFPRLDCCKANDSLIQVANCEDRKVIRSNGKRFGSGSMSNSHFHSAGTAPVCRASGMSLLNVSRVAHLVFTLV